MEYLNTFIQNFVDNPLLLLIPVFSGIIGYGTNWLAIKMMFKPLEFVGIPPFLGWQGLVPANADRVAGHTTDLITEKLVNLRMLFDKFEPEEFLGKLEPVLHEITEEIITEVSETYAPQMWSALGDDVKEQIREMLQQEVHDVALGILHDFSDNIEDILDLKEVIVRVVREDKQLFSNLFLKVGRQEFKFIEKSGAVFGFLFGIPQMVVWVLFPVWLILPIAGFLVGYLTNWLAIKFIFEPANPRKLGPTTIQGLFHKRKDEVAQDFADLVSSYFLNAENIVRISTEGTTGEKMFAIIENRVEEAIRKYESHPMAAMVKGMVDEDQMRGELRERIQNDMRKPGGFLHVFAGESVDIFDELFGRMKELDPESFESILRTPMKQDEWKLIVIGGILGFGAGVWQVVYLFGDMLAKTIVK